MNFINFRKRINFSFLTLVIVLIGFVLMSSGVINSSANSNDSQSNPAATFTVTNINDSGTGSLRQAILNANTTTADDVIDFAIPADNADCTSGVCTITLTSGALGANSAATGGKLTITNSTGASNLLISGNNTSRVFLVNSGVNLTINGLTITKGYTPYSGGGIYICSGGSLTNGTVTLTNSTVSGNTASSGGGGIDICNDGILSTRGTVTLFNSTVSGNMAFNSSGGGIRSIGGTVTLTNSTVSGNTASRGGGGIDKIGGTVTLTNSTVSGNTASSGGGGGIFNEMTLTNGGSLTLTNSTVSGNTASSGGGGIYNDNTLTLTNSTVSGNTASRGGGIYNFLRGGTLTNSTVRQYGDYQGRRHLQRQQRNDIDKLDCQRQYGGRSRRHFQLRYSKPNERHHYPEHVNRLNLHNLRWRYLERFFFFYS